MRIHQPTDDDQNRDAEWDAFAERTAAALEHDAAEVGAGRMSAEEYDARW